MLLLLELIALFLGVCFCVAVNMPDTWQFVSAFLPDAPAGLMLLVFVLPALLLRGMWKDLIRAVKLQKKSYTCSLNEMKKAQYTVEFLRKNLLWGGVIIILLGLMSILLTLPNDVDDWWGLGIGLTINTIPLLYVAMLEFLLLPLEVVVKRRILEFMEEE